MTKQKCICYKRAQHGAAIQSTTMKQHEEMFLTNRFNKNSRQITWTAGKQQMQISGLSK